MEPACFCAVPQATIVGILPRSEQKYPTELNISRRVKLSKSPIISRDLSVHREPALNAKTLGVLRLLKTRTRKCYESTVKLVV